MPLVRIDIPTATTSKDALTFCGGVHQALVKTFDVPLQDRFQTIHRRPQGELLCTPEFLGINHSASVVFIQIFCSFGRSLEVKKALYSEIVRQISSQTAFSEADIIINLVETSRENWSFGNGLAQYAL